MTSTLNDPRADAAAIITDLDRAFDARLAFLAKTYGRKDLAEIAADDAEIRKLHLQRLIYERMPEVLLAKGYRFANGRWVPLMN